MKKAVIIIAVIILLVVGGIEIALTMSKSDNTNSSSETKENAAGQTESVYFLKDGDKEIYLGEEFSKEKLGQEVSYSEVASCAFEGVDKTYTYENYEITTYPENGVDTIYTIYFLNEEMETTEGVKITDSFDRMVEIYGNDYSVLGNQYTYTKGRTNLEFIVEENTITSIQYSYTLE